MRFGDFARSDWRPSAGFVAGLLDRLEQRGARIEALRAGLFEMAGGEREPGSDDDEGCTNPDEDEGDLVTLGELVRVFEAVTTDRGNHERRARLQDLIRDGADARQ